MTKVELTKALANKVEGMTQKDAGVVVDSLGEVFVEALTKGEEVVVPGIGKIVVVERAAREARNPKTGETIHVESSKAVKLKAGSAIKTAINA